MTAKTIVSSHNTEGFVWEGMSDNQISDAETTVGILSESLVCPFFFLDCISECLFLKDLNYVI